MNTPRQILAKAVTINLLLLHATNIALGQALFELPSGPKGPGSFGAYHTKLAYDPAWDKHWRVGDHPDIVVRFSDGGHRFVFWRGTSYIPCWITENGIWYTNEFVERRGWHSPNTEGCVEPMSDKQCRYSQVRIIENNDARVVIHWRYAPVDVHYEHPFIDDQTGWFDWVDEYYVIYPDATGIRSITVHSGGLGKWIEFQEGIVINQPGTLPDDNIQAGAVSVANMQGEHVTYHWDEDGGPQFDRNPSRANMYKINLKSKRGPFAMVAPPQVDGGIITPYLGHNDRSKFNWWDHWPVSQDASDGRGAVSAARPSHTSLCHIDLPKPPPITCYGPFAGECVIRQGVLEWVTQKEAEMSLSFFTPTEMSDSLLVAFDYADLWTSHVSINLYDSQDNHIEIDLSEYADELSLNDSKFKRFEKKIHLPDYEDYDEFGELREIGIEVPDSDEKRMMRIDNLRFMSDARQEVRLNSVFEFDLPDGTLPDDIKVDRAPGWAPYLESDNKITKLMLHGLTTKNVEDLVPYARSWVNAPPISMKSDSLRNADYDKTQVAYEIQVEPSTEDETLTFTLMGSADTPIHNPCLVVHDWMPDQFELLIDEKKAEAGRLYQVGREKGLEGDYCIVWIEMESIRPVCFELNPIGK